MKVNRSNKSKWLYTQKSKKQTILCTTITDIDYADDIVLLANTPTQAESLLHSLEQAANDIGFHENAEKTEYISILNVGSLKLRNKFMYLGSRVLSTDNDINIHQAKTRTVIDRFSIIWKSDLSDKSSSHINSTIWMHLMDTKGKKKEDWNCTRML